MKYLLLLLCLLPLDAAVRGGSRHGVLTKDHRRGLKKEKETNDEPTETPVVPPSEVSNDGEPPAVPDDAESNDDYDNNMERKGGKKMKGGGADTVTNVSPSPFSILPSPMPITPSIAAPTPIASAPILPTILPTISTTPATPVPTPGATRSSTNPPPTPTQIPIVPPSEVSNDGESPVVPDDKEPSADDYNNMLRKGGNNMQMRGGKKMNSVTTVTIVSPSPFSILPSPRPITPSTTAPTPAPILPTILPVTSTNPPTPAVTRSPTNPPRQPTLSLFETPTPASTSCDIELDVECIPPINPGTGAPFPNCDFAGVECNEKVTLFSFRYDGGDCANSFTLQDSKVFICEDYLGGPPDIDEIGTESLIVVADIKGLGVYFFTGDVPIGGEFDVTHPTGGNELVASNINVTIYEGKRARENIRQTMIIHSSCSENTFLKDRYGSLLLVAFQNPSQGLVDCFFDVTFAYSVTSFYDDTTTLDTMTSIFSGFAPPTYLADYTPIVGGTALPSGQKLFLLETDPIEIDVSERIPYSVKSTIQALLDGSGNFCRKTDFTSFTDDSVDARPIPAPITPTFAPTPGATRSPTNPPRQPTLPLFETPTPASTSCDIELDVECIPPINPGTGAPFPNCDFAGVECNEKVTLFSFRYDGGDCANSFTLQDSKVFICEDYLGGPPDIDEIGTESLIVVADIKGLGVYFFTGDVPIGGEFDVTHPTGGNELVASNINVTIYEGKRARENIRQTMIIHSSCSENTFLKDRYGSLLLVAFQNPSQGLVDCFFDVTFAYSVTSFYDDTTTLDTMTSIFSGFAPPTYLADYTPIVGGTALPSGQKLFLLETDPIEIDVSERIPYSVKSTIQALLDGSGNFCRKTDFTSFAPGLVD